MKKNVFLFLLILASVQVSAQVTTMPFSKVVLRIDTMTFDSKSNLVTVNKEQRLYFMYDQEEQVCEVRLFVDDPGAVQNLKLLPSADYEMLDSLVRFNDFIQFRVKFPGKGHIFTVEKG